MANLSLVVKPIIYLESNYFRGFLTDHNRQPLQTSFEEVSTSARTVDGTLRSNVIARKQTYTLTWDTVPADASATVDGFWGGSEMLDFYLDTLTSFKVRVFNRQKAAKTYLDTNPEDEFFAQFTDFSYSIKNRNVYTTPTLMTDFWDVSMTLKRI